MDNRRELLQCTTFRVVEFDFETADGTQGKYQVVEHPGAAVIVPVLDDGRVVLIRNTRWSVDQELLELPAGTLEPGEPPLECAARELTEETGYVASRLEPLVSFYATPGICTERMHGFIATGLREASQSLDPTEQIVVAPTTSERVSELIANGQIQDGKTLSLLLYWQHVYRG